MALTWRIRILFLLMFAPGTTNDRESQPADTQPTCMPFNAIFIWHTGSGHDTSFFQQMRLIVTLILDFPERTEVSLVTVGAKVNKKMHFRKENTDESWIGKLFKHDPGKSGTLIIPTSNISDAILRNENPQMAEEVFLVVNDKSVIADKQGAAKALRKKNTCIIFSGEQTAKHVWTDLATDSHHFVLLGANTGNINGTAKSILIQTCQDFVPVTDSTSGNPIGYTDILPIINAVAIVVTSTIYCVREYLKVKQHRRGRTRTEGRIPMDDIEIGITSVAESGEGSQGQETDNRNENLSIKDQLDIGAIPRTNEDEERVDMPVRWQPTLDLPDIFIETPSLDPQTLSLINPSNGTDQQAL